MKLVTHLSFQGDCEQAFQCYAACLQGEITLMMKYRDAPAPCPAEAMNKIFHATLKLGEQTLTGVDLLGPLYEVPRGFSLQLNLSDRDRAQSLFDTFAEGGVVHFTLQPTSWAAAYASVSDRFGTPWEINCGDFT